MRLPRFCSPRVRGSLALALAGVLLGGACGGADTLTGPRLIVTPARLALRVGDTASVVVGLDAFADAPSVRWRSTNGSVAVVDGVTAADGVPGARALVRATGAGTADLTVLVTVGGGATTSTSVPVVVAAR